MNLLFLFCLAGLSMALSVTDVPSCAMPCVFQMLDADKMNGNISCTAQEDNRQKYRIVIIIFTTLAMLFVALRVASKMIARIPWGADDIWAFITFFILIPLTVLTLHAIKHGIGLAMPLFTKNDMQNAFKEIFIMHMLYLWGLAAAKTSILFFYLRIFPDKTFRILVWVTIAFNIVSTIIVVVLLCTIGRSATLLLNVKDKEEIDMRKFINAIKIVLASCVINLGLDVWMLILPMTQLYNIGLKLNKKISVMGMFGLGLFLTVVSLVRTILVVQLLGDPIEAEMGQVQVVLWACIETYVGSIVACVPSTRQLVMEMKSRMTKAKGQLNPKPIFIDRSLARIPDEEDIPTLSDVGGLTTVTASSGRTAVTDGMDHEMVIINSTDK
ncbi:hypothetical protein FMUND_6929 [Fusarium mundagurra]|uniref:Rhodopsin domain-containing protein n=1 Tax=Fusarium mundagurra TaxID=1567541 RepID=A0A8H5YQ71_9HYPO|nr:hypothetical protein FMUND_6929 [Fusarium mundagurra]